MERISEFFLHMKLFDTSGFFIGRVLDLSLPGSVTVLRREGGVVVKDIAEAKGFFWYYDPKDPAVVNGWKTAQNVPFPVPGLSRTDGYALGQVEGQATADSATEAPSWLGEPSTPCEPTGDDFLDGYLEAYMKTHCEGLRRRFPAGPKPAAPHWSNQRWGIDPSDPSSQEEFRRGEEFADKQPTWLSELQADKEVDRRCCTVAFRFGFKSRMEARFGKRY